MEAITSVEELYLEFIRDIYHAEILLIPELSFFIQKARSEMLVKVINNHLSNTRLHTSKLEELQENLHSDILQEHCRTMKSMIFETKEMVERCSTEKLIERAIVASLHRITHCQITVYQMLFSMADELKLPKHKKVLENNLNDEIDFDKQISAYGFNTLWQEFNMLKKL